MTIRHATVAFSHNNKAITLDQHLKTVREALSPFQVDLIEDDEEKSAKICVFLVQNIEDFTALEQGINKLEGEFNYEFDSLKCLNEKILKRAKRDVIKFAGRQPGARVGVILSTSDKETIMLGFGTYLGDFNPKSEGVDGPDQPNPKIKLDSGRIVWGFQSHWGAEELVRESMEKDQADGVKTVFLTEEEIEQRLYSPKVLTPEAQDIRKDIVNTARMQLLQTIVMETGTLTAKLWFRKWCQAYGDSLASEMNVLLGLTTEHLVPLPGDCKMTKLRALRNAGLRFGAGLLETDGRILMVVAIVEEGEDIKPLTAADMPWLHMSAVQVG